MRVGINAGRDAQKDSLADTCLFGDRIQGVQFLMGIYHNMSCAERYSIAQICVGFVVAVKEYPIHREARGVRCVQFTGGYAVCAHILLRHNAVHAFEAKGLARVNGDGFAAEAFRKSGFVHPAHLPDVLFIQHIQGRAVFLCKG